MLVPEFWAEARLRHRHRGRQITVRRFGWSDASPQDAQALADSRAREALERLIAGEPLARREPRVAYNGAQGVPIREEIVGRHGETILTRNAYGARCLNTPNVFFADLDDPPDLTCRFVAGLAVGVLLVSMLAGTASDSRILGIVVGIVGLVAASRLASFLGRMLLAARGGASAIARRRIDRFLQHHPDWSLRLYRTPAGFRLMATHQTITPDDPVVQTAFRALGADPVYVKMCRNQQCFRARVSAKPWRIGVEDHIKPQRLAWPIPPERQAGRDAWVTRYEAAAASFAACTFLETLGRGSTCPEAREVQELHDRLSRATSGLPIA